MKYIKLLTLVIIVTAMLSGCIKEDLDDCPSKTNVSLALNYLGDTNDSEMFSKMINSVTLYCFNRSTGALIKTLALDETELGKKQDIKFYLEPGDYEIISWANATESDTKITCESLTNGRVNHPNLALGTKVQGNDHLYFGSLSVTVGAEGMATGSIAHKGAHINMEIYVSGVGTEGTPSEWPIIEMSSLMPQYTITMEEAQAFHTTYYPTVTWNNEHNTSQALFQTLRFCDINDIVITIKDSDGTVLQTVNLQEFMETNNITCDGKNEATVTILIKFYEGQFTITIPEWTSQPVDPEL